MLPNRATASKTLRSLLSMPFLSAPTIARSNPALDIACGDRSHHKKLFYFRVRTDLQCRRSNDDEKSSPEITLEVSHVDSNGFDQTIENDLSHYSGAACRRRRYAGAGGRRLRGGRVGIYRRGLSDGGTDRRSGAQGAGANV